MAIRASFNGALGRNAELKTVGENKVTKFSVANNTGYGEKKKTQWVECDWWGNRGEKLINYLTKGQVVLVYGELEIHEYQAKDGTNKATLKCRVTDLELLGSKKEHEEHKEPSATTTTTTTTNAEFDDSIPF